MEGRQKQRRTGRASMGAEGRGFIGGFLLLL